MSDAPQSRWLAVFLKFIEHLRIVSKEASSEDERGVKLELWGSQRYLLERICEGMERGVRAFYCLKARQLGESTVTAALVVFWMATHPNMLGALVVDSDGNKEAFRDLLRRFVNSIPKEFTGGKFNIVKGGDNRYYMRFSNGARLDFLVAGGKKKPNWGEGRGYALAWLTEVGKYGDPDGLSNFEEALAQTNPDRFVIYESTGNGFNMWRDRYMQAKKDPLTKCAIFVPWCTKELNRIASDDARFEIYGAEPPTEEEQEKIDLVRERYGVEIDMEQLAWYRWRQADDSVAESSLFQNQPWTEEESFQLSGFSFFRMAVVQKDLARIYDTPIFYQGYRFLISNDFFETKIEQITEETRINEVELKVWYPPVVDAKYVIGIDPAYGRNDWKDRTVISVWRCYADRLVQCAEYATSEAETFQAAWVMFYLAGLYRDCILNVELSGGPGRAIMREFDSLRDRLNSEIFVHQVDELGWYDVIGNARWFLYHRADSMGAGYVYNSETTARSKFEIMNSLRDTYTTGQAEVNSAAMLEEMLTVAQDGSSIEAPNRGKDDRVIGFALANYVWITWRRPELLAQGMSYARVTADETGDAPSGEQTIKNIVTRFFQRQNEALEHANDPEQWLVDRGLV
jgi:hypothetical protein